MAKKTFKEYFQSLTNKASLEATDKSIIQEADGELQKGAVNLTPISTVDVENTESPISGAALGSIGIENGDNLAPSIRDAGNVSMLYGEYFVEGKEVVFATSDSADNALDVFFTDGTHTNYMQGIQDDQTKTASDYPNAEKGALLAENDFSVYQIGADGKVRLPNLDLDNQIDGVVINSTADFLCVGDSLTYGTGATAASVGQQGYPYRLANHYTGGNGFRRVFNYGIGGQSGNQIATRMGAYPVMVDLDDDEIPASGSTDITLDVGANFLFNINFSYSQYGWLDVGGTLYYGAISRAAGANPQQYTFTRSTIGTAVTGLTSTYRWIPDLSDLTKRIVCIWITGHNDSLDDDIQYTILKSVQAIVNQLPLNAKFIVLSAMYGETFTSTEKGYIDNANNLLECHFPDRFLALTSELDSATYYADGGVHLVDAGYEIVKDRVIEFITQQGW